MGGHIETENLTAINKKNNDNSTEIMIQCLKPEVTEGRHRSPGGGGGGKGAISPELLNRLQKLKLGNDPHMINLIAEYPKYGNRLISLFKEFKEFKIELTDGIECIIAANIPHVGGAVNLLGLMKELSIDRNSVSVELLFHAAKSDSTVAQSAREMFQVGALDPSSFNLILKYPGQSFKISQLIVNLQERAYNSKELIDKLHVNSISAEHMDTTLDLLSLFLENDVYDLDVMDILLRQEQYINKIYNGAKKLAAYPNLLTHYFEFLEGNPQNANIFAKNILLLNGASLINSNDPDDFSKVSKLGVGAFHFMKHLKEAGMLNAGSYQKICQDNNFLSKRDVVDALSNLPLMTKFSKEELASMLDIISKPEASKSDTLNFLEILENHLIASSPSPRPICNK